MANLYDNQLSHMEHLMFYGAKNEEVKKSSGSIVENVKEGADGKMYGIVYEGTKYYIKSCEKGRENLNESFDYVGGWMGRKRYEYSSFAKASKNLDMMLMSLNEDYHKRLPVNEAKKNEFKVMDDSMLEMQGELTRFGQILESIDQIYMNKKNGIGDRNIGVPEAPKTQEYNSKVSGPFINGAEYEENRDNKENSKDHEKEGNPFEENGEPTNKDMQSDALNTGKGEDVYSEKPKYAPENSIAAMNPSGGKVVRVNEENEVDPVIDLENDPAIADYDTDEYLDNISKPTEDGEIPELEDLAPADAVSNSEEIAGIDDMSGVDRNLNDEGVIGAAVNEAVDFTMKNKNLESIVESVIKGILSEDGFDNDGDRYFMHDSDFRFQGPNDGKKKMKGSVNTYQKGKGRTANLHKNPETGEMEWYDETGPNYVNPNNIEYSKDHPNKGQNKYGLNLNDDPMDDADDAYTRTGAWEDTEEKARKYANPRVSQAQTSLLMNGYDDIIDSKKVIDTFRHAIYILQSAKNDAAYELGVNPKMIENFLSSNFSFGKEYIETDDGFSELGDELNAKGYRDAKISSKCFITPDGELPYNEANKKWCEENLGGVVVGPSLKAVGFMNQDGSDLSTDDLKELVDKCLEWDDKWAQTLEDEENVMRDNIDYIHELEQHEDFQNNTNLRGVVSEWMDVIEQFGSLHSLMNVPIEALNKRDTAIDMERYGKMAGDEGYGVFSRSAAKGGLVGKKAHMNEEMTVLHDFGNHPGYRKKPMKHPEATEVAINGARDWNDESAKSSEPFGKQIGSSAPYDTLVDEITKRVVEALGGMNK